MVDWREREERLQQLKDERSRCINKEDKKAYTKKITPLMCAIWSHNNYFGDRPYKRESGDCYILFGKTYKELSKEELREYNKLKKREWRKKLKK